MRNPHVVKAVLYGKYGVRLAVYRGYTKKWDRFKILERRGVKFVELMIRGGSIVPRFFLQKLARKFQDAEAKPPTPIEFFLMAVGTARHGPVDLIAGPADDTQLFESYSNNIATHYDNIYTLIVTHQFVPLHELTPCATLRITQLAELDPTLLDTLVRDNGMDLRPLNDPILGHILSSTHTSPQTLPEYFSRGLRLTPTLVTSQLQNNANPTTLHLLSLHVPAPILETSTVAVLTHNFGPDAQFSPTVVTTLVDHFNIPSTTIATALFHRHPSRGGRDAQATPYVTRCYDQASPFAAWKWVLARYGPTHELTTSCFDDLALWVAQSVGAVGSWAAAAAASGVGRGRPRSGSGGRRMLDVEGVWRVVYQFLDKGVLVAPKHVEGLATAAVCSTGAVDVLARALERVKAAGSASLIGPDEKNDWLTALKTHIVRNKKWCKSIAKADNDWTKTMAMEISGGGGGLDTSTADAGDGTHKMPKPSRFLEIAVEMVKILEGPKTRRLSGGYGGLFAALDQRLGG
ncbi:hypothetical protein HK104_004510 [Borealophlyctis nickersoniae]|nr:hypothetical protein HK104_004510 [Borealophlyctis nickersoniae]